MLGCFDVQICMPQLVNQIQNTMQNTIFWPWQVETHSADLQYNMFK